MDNKHGDKRAHVRGMSGQQLQAVQQNLKSEQDFARLFEAAKAGNLEAVETLNDICEVVASRRAEWQRGFILNLLSLPSASTVFAVLTGKAKLKPFTISERAITQRANEIGFKFFRTGDGHGKVPGVKSVTGDGCPVVFFPESYSLTVANYTPIGGVDLHTLSAASQYSVIRKANYGVPSNPDLLNASITLKIGANIYLSESSLTDLGINYWTDRKRATLPIDTMLIANANTEIEAQIVAEEITFAANQIFNFEIKGVCIAP